MEIAPDKRVPKWKFGNEEPKGRFMLSLSISLGNACTGCWFNQGCTTPHPQVEGPSFAGAGVAGSLSGS